MASEAEREKRRRERQKLVGHKWRGIVPVTMKPCAEDLRQRYAEIPEDTRDLTALICGDPLRGRSALDKRVAP